MTQTRRKPSPSLVSESKHLTVGEFIEKIEQVFMPKAIVHVETDFGLTIPVLMVWDESMQDGEGDPGELGIVTLAYAVRFDDDRAAYPPYSAKSLVERLSRVKNRDAVIHTGGTELTPEPVSGVRDETHMRDDCGNVGAVIVV